MSLPSLPQAPAFREQPPRTQRLAPPAPPGFDVRAARDDFPILRQKIHGEPLVYLDNAATTQKPRQVIDALTRYYGLDNANVHRGVHDLSQRATRAFEEARLRVQRFLGVGDPREVIFTRGTTEGINLVAQSWGRSHLKPGDEVLISWMEHHSNIVPWQMACEQTGAVLKVIPVNDDGELILEEFDRLLSDRTRMVSVVHVSNALGTVNPVRYLIDQAHARGARVLIDGAQSASHLSIDFRDSDADFFVCSGHKLYGPTGIGVLVGKAALLERMPPYQGGGDMIRSVSFAGTTYADLPSKFEAGTPDIAGAVGLAAAMDYLDGLGLEAVAAHEDRLLEYGTARLRDIPGVRLIGTAADKVGVLSFVVDDPPVSALDVGTRLDLAGVAVRTGHHCCQPLMERFGVPGTARASLALYNTVEDVDRFADVLAEVVRSAGGRCRIFTCGGCALAPEVTFAPPSAASPEEAADELADVFDFLGDWQERYRHIIELGEKIPPLPDALKTEANLVKGCQSRVYFQPRIRPGTADVIEFLADSDSDIVRGLIAVLEKLYSGQPAEKVLAFDVEGFFTRLGLDAHLSLNRRNGLSAMVGRIRAFAASQAAG